MKMLEKNDIDRIYHQWNDALARKDKENLIALYSEDAVLESPLIPHLLQGENGVIQGKKAILEVLEILFQCQPAKRKFYRDSYFTDGEKLMWEYPRLTPYGEQMDFAEVMEIRKGLIQKHRVYWGWYGINVLNKNEHFS